MITVKEAREKALSFLSEQGLEREFIENVSVKLDDAEKLIREFETKFLQIVPFRSKHTKNG